MKKNIAIFASGRGSNTKNIIDYFEGTDVNIGLIVTNNPKAGVIEFAVDYNIPYLVISKTELNQNKSVISSLESYKIDFIVLAGFLLLIPQEIVNYYKNRIINIHPALLPRYGGKGMYGMKVHEAVKDSGDNVTGITIHFVNEKYDDGDIIFQKEVEINANDIPEDIAQKVHQLEYKYFPKVIEDLLKN